MESIIRWFKNLFSTSSSSLPVREQNEIMGVEVSEGVKANIDPVLAMDTTPKPPSKISFQKKLWTLEFEGGKLLMIGGIDDGVKVTATVLKYVAFQIDSHTRALLQVEVPDPSQYPDKTRYISDSDSRFIKNFQGWNSKGISDTEAIRVWREFFLKGYENRGFNWTLQEPGFQVPIELSIQTMVAEPWED